jgi:hypothetical protein
MSNVTARKGIADFFFNQEYHIIYFATGIVSDDLTMNEMKDTCFGIEREREREREREVEDLIH